MRNLIPNIIGGHEKLSGECVSFFLSIHAREILVMMQDQVREFMRKRETHSISRNSPVDENYGWQEIVKAEAAHAIEAMRDEVNLNYKHTLRLK